MKYWNELDNTIFFNKVFTYPVEIGEITLFSVTIDNDRPNIGLGFDIPETPDIPPEKWIKEGFNTCRTGLDCGGLSDIRIKNIPTKEKLKMVIIKRGNYFELHATSKSSAIELKAKFISLCGPAAYFNHPDSACD
ncbi:Imm50 family immunity protein [Pseudomonas poae]|uniref:Immunity protein 50 n=1 Tax=Pseudomonas poae TaxID=200451 RepID=A0ABY0REV0_9PSED|nr:Imm50 family immunity protein [Pseudomonas poae]SDN81500.1 Immunity protein 50 [Pseudomonas poae]